MNVEAASKENSYLEVEDDCPDEAKSEFGISINNILSSNVDLNKLENTISALW